MQARSLYKSMLSSLSNSTTITEGPKRPKPCPNLYVASCVQRYLPDPDCAMPAVEGLVTMGRLSGEVHNGWNLGSDRRGTGRDAEWLQRPVVGAKV